MLPTDVYAVELGEGLGEQGRAHLREGAWETARQTFESALQQREGGGETAEALEGLAEALWWLGDLPGAVHHRERAYAELRRQEETGRAARNAVWLAREYAAGLRNQAAASGWLARAETLLAGREGEASAERGWLELVRSETAADPASAERHATAALDLARSVHDVDLEIQALAQLGLALVELGMVSAGMLRCDEAMAAATGGEAVDPKTFGDACCKVVACCELASDVERMGQWAQVVNAFMERHRHLPLLAFCGSCCAEMFVATGAWSQAEQQLLDTLKTLRAAGQETRCVHPAARLAELRILQGRYEEAEGHLRGHEHLPEALRATVSLQLARGEHAVAAGLLERRLRQLGTDTLLSAPFLSLLVDSRLAAGEVAAAQAAATRLDDVARRSANPRVGAEAALQLGRVAIAGAAGDPEGIAHLERALAAFQRQGNPLEVARTRLELARALAGRGDGGAAVAEARGALALFDELGASREAGEAAALLRRLGVSGRTGPKGKDMDKLSRREVEVLHLLGQGLTNAEIADRLVISVKTAGNHVGSILDKLAVRNRAEAATYAQRIGI